MSFTNSRRLCYNLLVSFVLFHVILHFVSCHENTEQESSSGSKKREKRSIISSIETIISIAIKAGASLIGSTISGLRNQGPSVSVAGSVENPTQWRLHLDNCKAVEGEINNPMVSVSPGEKEGFASHKSGALLDEFKGTIMKCKFHVNKTEGNAGKKTYVNIAYEVPRITIFSSGSNKLAFAVCTNSDENCEDLDGKSMLGDKTYTFLNRRVYKHTVATLFFCHGGICVSGTMGTSQKTTIKIKVYPQQFQDLYQVVQQKLKEKGIGPVQYQQFIKNEEKVSKENKDTDSGAIYTMFSWSITMAMVLVATFSFVGITG